MEELITLLYWLLGVAGVIISALAAAFLALVRYSVAKIIAANEESHQGLSTWLRDVSDDIATLAKPLGVSSQMKSHGKVYAMSEAKKEVKTRRRSAIAATLFSFFVVALIGCGGEEKHLYISPATRVDAQAAKRLPSDIRQVMVMAYGSWVDDLLEEQAGDKHTINGMTLGKIVMVPNEYFDRPLCARVSLLAHEGYHIKQNMDRGFLGSSKDYLLEYWQNRAEGLGDYEAYLTIEEEEQAREAEKKAKYACMAE